ncbi:MAG TPA: outer membrane beta-barrel protein [Myxococcota bacterium]|nr:outer membrane beta-barrel protein [Myxococcota bacterium]
MKYLAISALLLVSTFAAQVARADDDPYARSGGYVEVGGTRGVNFFEGTIDDAFAPLNSVEHAHVGDSWGAWAAAGYRFNKYLATEGEYEWMKGFHASAGGVHLFDVETQTATINLKVIAPYGAFEPYFKVGGGVTWASVDKAFFSNIDVASPSFSARFGAGLDYYLSQNFFLNIGTDVVFNTAKVSSGGLVGNNNSGRGLTYLGAQAGFGFRF